MNAEIFAEWLCRQGHRVIRTANGYWFDQGPRSFQAFPYHHLRNLSKHEIADFLVKHKAICVRFSAPINAGSGTISYHTVYSGHAYDMSMLDRRTRQNIRKGLSHCSVEPISFERLANEGFFLELDTVRRQGRNVDFSRKAWRRKILAAQELPGFEAWGALVNGQLGASLFTFQMEECCYMLYAQCARQFLPMRITNALSYQVTKTMVERETVSSVLYGLCSLCASPSVDEFKFRMGYTAEPVRLCVAFHPWMSLFVNRFAHHTLSRLAKGCPRNNLLSKAEGMLRFYLEGKAQSDIRCPTRSAMEGQGACLSPLGQKPCAGTTE